jgi:hypothetical protein
MTGASWWFIMWEGKNIVAGETYLWFNDKLLDLQEVDLCTAREIGTSNMQRVCQ